MATRTLAELRQMVRELSDNETTAQATAFVDDAELDPRINEALSALRDLRIDLEGQEWAAKTGTITTASGTEVYPLPPDFDTLLGVRCEPTDGGNTEYTLEPWDYEMLASLRNVADGTYPTHYRLKDADGDKIDLKPTPTAVVTVYIDYVPSYTELDQAADETFSMPYGWWKWAALFAAIDILNKEDLDATALTQKWQAEDQRVRRRAGRRDASRAPRIKDTRQERQRMLGGFPRLWRSS